MVIGFLSIEGFFSQLEESKAFLSLQKTYVFCEKERL